MNDNASGIGRLNKSPVAGRFRPSVGRKEKNFLEEVRAEARAQRKASERIDLEKLGSNNTEMDSEKPRVLEAPVLAEGIMGSRDYTKTPPSLRAAVERLRKTRERLGKIDWERKASERIDLENLPVLAEGRMGSRDYTKSTPPSLRADVERLRKTRERLGKIDWERKAWERFDLEKLGSNNTEMDSEKPRVLEAPVLAEGRMGSRDYTKSTPSSLRVAGERMRRTRERLEKIDWDKVITSKRMRMRYGDYTKSKEASASYGKTVLPEASASCDKMDSDHLAYRNEGKQISPGKHVTVTGGDSQA